MIKNIGLMLTRNEEDVIQEVMEEISKYFQMVMVMDDSDDKTVEILKTFDCVKYIANQKQVYGNIKPCDGIRQHILWEAQKSFGYGGWFTLLHGDEIFHDNPNIIAADASRLGCEVVVWHSLQFFMHTSEKDNNMDHLYARVQERRKWYSPGCYEVRQFKNKPNIAYPIDQQHSNIPLGIAVDKTYPSYPIFKHYHIRTEAQAIRRAKDRVATGWQAMYSWILEKGVYVDIYPGLTEAKHVDVEGFKEYEIKQQIMNSIIAEIAELKTKINNLEELARGFHA